MRAKNGATPQRENEEGGGRAAPPDAYGGGGGGGGRFARCRARPTTITRRRISAMTAPAAIAAPTRPANGADPPGSCRSAWMSVLTVGSCTIEAPPRKLRPARRTNPTNALPCSPIARILTPATTWPYTGCTTPSTMLLPAHRRRAIRVQFPAKSMLGVWSRCTVAYVPVVSFAERAPAVLLNSAVPEARVRNQASTTGAGIRFPTTAPSSSRIRRRTPAVFPAAYDQPSISWSHFRS